MNPETIILQDRMNPERYYELPKGQDYDPSKYSLVEEKSSSKENNALVVSSTGTVKSPELPEWLSKAIGPIQGALDVGKGMVGPGVGGVAGSAIGGAAAGLMGPEAIPAGMYLGGIVGGGAGQTVSDLLRFGETRPAETGKVMATDAILGPIGAGASAATKGILRKTPIVGRLMGSLQDQASASGDKILMGGVSAEASRQLAKPQNFDPGTRKDATEILNNIINEVYARSGANYGEMNPYDAASIIRRIGKLQENPAANRAEISDPLYHAAMDLLREQGYSSGLMSTIGGNNVGGNNAARLLLQSLNENAARRAVNEGISKTPLLSGVGLGAGAYFGSRMLNDPMSALAALGIGTLPAGYSLGKGLAQAGWKSFNPYAYGIGGVMEGLTGQ